MSNPRRTPSLKEKISGPRARPIAQLVTQGDLASQRVQESFHDFLDQRVSHLESLFSGLMRGLCEDFAADWQEFFTVVRDIRGSSALAQNKGANTFCKSLETLLQERDCADPRMGEAIQSHIGALRLIASGRAGNEESQDILAAHLAKAVDALPVKTRDFRAP